RAFGLDHPPNPLIAFMIAERLGITAQLSGNIFVSTAGVFNEQTHTHYPKRRGVYFGPINPLIHRHIRGAVAHHLPAVEPAFQTGLLLRRRAWPGGIGLCVGQPVALCQRPFDPRPKSSLPLLPWSHLAGVEQLVGQQALRRLDNSISWVWALRHSPCSL